MVGPGDVDNELEPEVKDECNTKYGEVASVIINEIPNVAPEEAVRIFVEFKRIESAIKAVVDLNGRFFVDVKCEPVSLAMTNTNHISCMTEFHRRLMTPPERLFIISHIYLYIVKIITRFLFLG